MRPNELKDVTEGASVDSPPPLWQRLLRSPTVWIFAGIVILGLLVVQWLNELGGPQVFRERYGGFAPLVTVGVHIILALTPFPSDVMAMANGVLYGFWLGVCLTWLGWVLAGILEFALGRRARHDFCLDTALSKAPGWIRHFPVSHPVYLLASRQIPWLGGHVSTFVPGAAGVSWSRFLWCSALAIIPSSILMTGIGAGIAFSGSVSPSP